MVNIKCIERAFILGHCFAMCWFIILEKDSEQWIGKKRATL